MRVFTVLGPSQSGKSTLVQALAALDGRPQRFEIGGVVALTGFSFLSEPWVALEVDGGADALAQAGPALALSDAAVLCVPPDPEAAVLAAPYLRLLEEAGIPSLVFINRIDAPTGRIRDVVAALQAYANAHITLRQIPIRDGDRIIGAVDLISERAWKYRDGEASALIEIPRDEQAHEQQARAELLEELSDFDDRLLEQLIEDRQPASDALYHLAADVLQKHALIPAVLGSASHGNGLRRLMKALRHEVPQPQIAAERAGAGPQALALSGLADHRKHMGKMVLLRALGDGLAANARLGGAGLGTLTELDGKTQIDHLAPGALGLAVKSDHLEAGRVYDPEAGHPLPAWSRPRPAGLRQCISPEHDRDDARLSAALARMAAIDPGLELGQDAATGQAVIGLQGPLHLRRLTEKLLADFGLGIAVAPVDTAFRETPRRSVETHHRHRKQSGGAGQFADVVLTIAPQPRGAGFLFEDIVKGGAVPKSYIPAVAQGAEEALASGPGGFPVVDVKVTLKDGKSHSVDSSDHAFRTAGKGAVRDALAEAGTQTLQPVLKVELHLPSVFVGDLVPALSSLQGQVLGFQAHPDARGWDLFQALLPETARDDLIRTLASATRGTGWASFGFDHFEELRGPAPGAARAD